MYRNRKDVDKHVESLLSRLSSKEFFSRGYSIGRLYYEVGDYSSCRRYVEQYVTQNNTNAAAHTLLGQALQKLGLKEKALEEFKTSYGICPSQNSLVLNICEILADETVDIDPGRAKHWLDIAEKTFPRHALTFQLREKLMTISNPDPQALATLLTEELANRPKDVLLHIRLLKSYMKNNNIEAAFTHSCNVEFSETNFVHNFDWYKTVAQILKCNPRKDNDWNFQLLLLTVTERMCSLSLTETHNHGGTIVEASELLHVYDQTIERVASAGFDQGKFSEFHLSLLQHHRSQFAFHAATFLLKRGEDYNWSDANRDAEPLMLIAWQSAPFDPTHNWVNSAPKAQQNAARRWYCEGSYRCSQSGHYLLSNVNDKIEAFLDRISQSFAGILWQDKLYERIFSNTYHLEKIKTSYLHSSSFKAPDLNLPRRSDIEIYDAEAQRAYGNSLHHFVWMLLNYKDYSQFRCTTFDVLPLSVQNDANCSPESLCQLDVYAFLYCATLTSRKNSSSENLHWPLHKPKILPANITPLLCTITQMKWWDCAFKFSRNELGTEMSDIRATLSRGIETVRCIDNHGLNPELLCKLGRIFSNRAKQISDIDQKRSWELRAVMYFSAAIPLLEKGRNDIISKADKHMFDYIRRHLLPKETSSLLEECKLYVALYQLNDGENEKAIKLLSNLKSPQALYFLSDTYKKMALDINTSTSIDNRSDIGSTVISLLSKALDYGQEALYKLKDPENKSNHLLLMETEDLLREIETNLNKNSSIMENNGKLNSSSDEYVSFQNDDVPFKNQSLRMGTLSSTPIRSSNFNNYRTPVQSQIMDNQTIESQKINATMNDFMELTKSMIDENRVLGNQIINSMSLNTKNTVDEFAQLKISVDKLKEQIDECRNECKDIGELKNEVMELKKEISKLKKASDQAAVENEFLNLDEEYRANETASTIPTQLPFASQQVMPPFNQPLIPPFSVPPNPFQLYGQNWFNIYNHNLLNQPPTVPGARSLFDAARSSSNYPGVFPTPDQMYLDVANLVQQTMPPAPTVPVIPPQTSVPTPMMPPLPVVAKAHSTVPTTIIGSTRSTEAKETAHSLPANVVITSSDPLPTCTTTPAPILSVTIPSKHIKGIPHNYQIKMPETESAPVTFGFPTLGAKINSSSPSTNFNQTTVFKSVFTNANAASTISFSPKLGNTNVNNEVEKANASLNKANESLNKSRTLSEKSNTSVDNYDPCPDFKPIIPLPAEVVVTTGEEDETVIFNARAKLFRFANDEWKERGLGEMKLLKHRGTGKVRVLMRREQIHKICANHHITPEMEIKPMKNELKAYIWVANDFADEKFVLEKLCIRFKTAEVARQFYETFEKARQEMAKSQKSPQVQQASKTLADKSSKPQDTLISTTTKDSQPAITKFGGFTFTSTPSFKPVEDKKPVATSIDATPKTNVFSGLNFKTDPSSSLFKNLSAFPNTQINHSNIQSQDAIPNKSTDSVEEYEPTTEFKPVVPLPALVDTKTGEEDEIVLFEHRAKLLRFIASSEEWKERGVGNIKLLAHKDNDQKVRLLMRREQVMKVCCNHAITKSMVFQRMPKVDKAVNWCAQDFSEGELTPEIFCLRFSTVQACNDFIDAVKRAQSKLKDESKAAKEEQNAAKQNYQIGDKNTIGKPAGASWGDKFKPKQGSWECKACFVRNEENIENCSACNTTKNPNTSVKETKLSNTNNDLKFSFGVPSQALSNGKTKDTPKSDKPVASGWGDQFKPKQGSWECQGCFVRNNPDVEICPACNASRHPGGAKPESKGLLLNSEVKFKFGIPEDKSPAPSRSDMFSNDSSANPSSTVWSTGATFNFGVTPTAGDKPKNETTNIFDGTGVHKFSFGTTPKVQEQSAYVFSKGNIIPKPERKPALLPTPPQIPADAPTFGYVFKPKTETKAKSPLKNEQGDDSDGNEYASEDEGHHIQIAPIVPLPEKITVVTGEEDEDEVFAHRAKLFIFVKGEWKERGLGVVKILRHKHTAKLRVVMRREQVHKICLNHALTKDITYNLKNDNTWIFAANDFSEGELTLLRCCLKFKTKEIALQFKHAVDNARDGKNPENLAARDSDVEFVTETKSNEEEKLRAKVLMLPENFYLYENKDPCPGCRGCEDEQTTKPEVSENNTVPIRFQGFPTTTTTTPLKISSIASNESIYFTPKARISSSFFQTPESESNVEPVSQPANEATSKNGDNVIQKPKPFSVDNQSSILKPSTFIPPMNINNTSSTQAGIISGSQDANPKSIFATANSGLPKNSVFAFPPKDKSNTAHTIFGTDLNNKPSSDDKTTQSIFGSQYGMFDKSATTMLSKPNQTSVFSSGNTTNYFGNGKSIFNLNTNSDKKTANETDTSKTDLDSKELILGSGTELTFDSYSNKPVLQLEKNPDFKWEGAGQQLFAHIQKPKPGNDGDNDTDAGNGDDDYDPHYEPIVPLPEKIVVTTGEEDEEKIFGQRCKLFRMNQESKEWKERGVGELKVLYHPEKKTYRLLFRREQVHKAVLNMLLFADFPELLPLKKSVCAWTWSGRNFAESDEGVQELLAVRFKNVELATEFEDAVKTSVRKLQAAAAQAIREEQEKKEEPKSFASLRLPKHLQDSARADNDMAMSPGGCGQAAGVAPALAVQPAPPAPDVTSRLLFQADYTQDDDEEDDGEHYDQDYYGGEDDWEPFSSECTATISTNGGEERCVRARVTLVLDPDVGVPRLLLADAATGEQLNNLVLQDETDLQLSDCTCTWSGLNCLDDELAEVMVAATFADEDIAMKFFDCCESTRGATQDDDDEDDDDAE